MVVGLIDSQGSRVLGYGRRAAGDVRPLDGDTLFEIGSISKVFTALLLADMVQRGEVALASPISTLLPPSSGLPPGAGALTPLELATHTSGLPIMPHAADLNASRPSQQDLFRGLGVVSSGPPSIRRGWSYSDYGYWLLGEALAARGGATFDALLRSRVLQPLGLQSTAILLSPDMRQRLAPGHDASLNIAPAFNDSPTFALMPAAGGLISSTNDLLTLLGVALGQRASPTSAALASMLTTRVAGNRSAFVQALGWMLVGDGDDMLVVHDGGTLGYATAMAWSPSQRRGAVILSNHVVSVSDIARHFVNASLPLAATAITRRTEVTLASALLDACVGRYEAPGEGTFTIARDGDHLTIQTPPSWGLPAFQLRPESADEFFVAELPLRLSVQNSGRRVSAILVYPPRGQRAVLAPRIQ